MYFQYHTGQERLRGVEETGEGVKCNHREKGDKKMAAKRPAVKKAASTNA